MTQKLLELLFAFAVGASNTGALAQKPAVPAAAPAGATQQVANAVDPASIQALKSMGSHLQTLKRFQVSTKLTGERVLADGQKSRLARKDALQVPIFCS